MKRHILLSLALVFVLLSSACGSGGGETSAPSGGGSVDADGHVTLEFWYSLSGDSGQTVEDLVQQFNESQDNITVVATYQGDYATTMAKLYSAIAGGTVPNVAQVGGAPLLRDSNTLVPIADFLSGTDGSAISGIRQVFLDYNTADGVLWSMPFNNSLPILYYNEDLFTAAGLDPASPPQNFDELLAAAQALTVDSTGSGTPSQWGLNTRDDTHWYLSTMILSNGGQIVNDTLDQMLYNNAEGVAMLSVWNDWVNTYHVTPPNQHNESQSDFLSGRLGMLFSSSASVLSMEQGANFELGTTMFPAIGDSPLQIPIGGGSLAIFTNENQAILDASWQFVQFMSSRDSSLYLSTHTGYLPIYEDAAEWPEMQTFLTENPNRQAAIDSLQYAVVIPIFQALGTSDASLRQAIEQVELNAATPQEALDEAKANTENFIAQQSQ